jgi:hypothetical protein
MTTINQPPLGLPSDDGSAMPPAESITVESPVVPSGFQLPKVEFVTEEGVPGTQVPPAPSVLSTLSTQPAISAMELIELSGGSGKLLYYPVAVPLAPGDVLYLRERDQGVQRENGIIVQVITKETATYAQVGSKVLWRLLTKVRAQELHRAHHEPAEIIDLFLTATVKVRFSVKDGNWESAAGSIVTRNVDIFLINPKLLLKNILTPSSQVNVHIGAFQGQPVVFSGQNFDKINLIPGMKGAGKSHLTKGIIDESQQRGMSAVVFDINDEYKDVPGATVFIPTVNLKFRLDRTVPRSLLDVIERLSPFSERTSYGAMAAIHKIYDQHQQKSSSTPLDLAFLKTQKDLVVSGTREYQETMKASYVQSLETVERWNLFATAQEIKDEEVAMKSGKNVQAKTLSSALHALEQQGAGVMVFSIGGFHPTIQRIVVKLVLDALKDVCDRQTKAAKQKPAHIPIYPSVYFEEAHMYMDHRDINELIPVIRHLGMNLFFITNTPGELPDSVFRLVDNVIMTRMLNEADIQRIVRCGLADRETIVGFAPEIPERHALVLSAKNGITQTFPLIFEVRDFGHPLSGVTRSMWHKLETTGGTGTGGSNAGPASSSVPDIQLPASDGDPSFQLSREGQSEDA